MKIQETIRLLYQYLYYSMRVWDEQLGLSDTLTKSKFGAAICYCESWVLAAIYGLIQHIIFGRKIVIPDFLFSYTGLLLLFAYAFVLCHYNTRVLGSDKNIQHHAKIFVSWSKGKRILWELYTYLIMAFLWVTFFVVITEVNDYGINPKSWKWDGNPEDYYGLYFWIIFIVGVIILSKFATKVSKPGRLR